MAEKTKLWYLQNFNLLEGMDKNSMEEFSKMTHMKESTKKDIIYFPDEPSNTIYFLKEGKIKISRITDDGRTTALDLLGPGEIFGEGALLGQDTHTNMAEAMENTVVCSISKEMFEKMLKKNPMVNRSINKFIGFRMRKIQAHVEDLVFKNAQERIEAFLKRYAKTFGKQMVDGCRVRPFLAHHEIANLTATARQTVNAVLNDLVDEGKIEYTRRYFHVKDLAWLEL
ncbi:MAG: Crp/Fnr family transcriptional regulator [Candidatus Marinimicrobia bacterium]|nr:Crp/Fnr family transcriptional regulator [Candidatus Neomarinimicrobiota bacterium]